MLNVFLTAELFGWSAAFAITITKSSYNDAAGIDEKARFIYETVST
jgi:hypothetical protein